MSSEVTSVEVLGKDAISALTQAEVDVQIATARRWPRSITDFRNRLQERATLNAETAQSCTYSLKRRNSNGETVEITGPSVRFAEIVAQSYGNLRSAARVIEEGQRFVVAQGICHDLETNIVISTEVRVRITTSKGRRYGDDMVGVTSNAACAKALRNSILRVVPKALWSDIYEGKVKQAALGGGTLQEHVAKALDAYKQLGATDEQVTEALGRRGVDDITIDDVVRLRSWYRLIRDGEMTLEDALTPASKRTESNTNNGNGRKPSVERVDPPSLRVEATQPEQPKQDPDPPNPAPASAVDTEPPVEVEDEIDAAYAAAANDPETVVTLTPGEPLPGDEGAP